MSRRIPKWTKRTIALQTKINQITDRAELQAVFQSYKDRWGQLNSMAATEWFPGDRAMLPLRGGGKVLVEVVKRNRKTIRVDAVAGFGSWNAAPSLLERVLSND